MKKYSKQDQKLFATWAADCAERVLPFFEKAYPNDKRPRKAIEACRTWVRTGIFKMADIRKASLNAHAAARKAKNNNSKIAKELNWQSKYLPKHLRKDWKDWQSKHLPKSLRKNNNFLNFIFINSFISFL